MLPEHIYGALFCPGPSCVSVAAIGHHLNVSTYTIFFGEAPLGLLSTNFASIQDSEIIPEWSAPGAGKGPQNYDGFLGPFSIFFLVKAGAEEKLGSHVRST